MDEITPFGDQGWREPMMMDDGALRCGECGAPVARITRGHQVKDGKVGPMEPARFGCGHLAGKLGKLVQMDLSANALGLEAYWPEPPGVAPRRMRIDDNLGSVLLMVGDIFEEGGRYVQLKVDRSESDGWSQLDWDEAYDRLAKGMARPIRGGESIMSATQVTRPPVEPIVRAGVSDMEVSTLATIRAYVLAADEHYQARTRLETIRAMLDVLAGSMQELTYGGVAVLTFEDQLKRSVDVDRLAARWPEAYADVVTATDGYRLSIGTEIRRLLRKRTWRAAMARRSR